MYDRVLVPLDGSKMAEQVLPYVKVIQEKMGSHVELVKVIEEPHLDPSNPTYNAYLEQMAATLQKDSTTYLQELAESLREGGLATSWTVESGDPAVAIRSMADSRSTTLVAMCSHGRSGLSRWWIGSTTDKVIHAVSNAVLVVRAGSDLNEPEHAGFKDCIVPLDGSAQAEQVLDHLEAWARALALKVNLVRVVPELDSHMVELFPEVVEEDRVGKAREYLEGVKTRLQQQGISEVELTLEQGHPANVLVDLARSSPESLMIMGTLGLGSSGVYRWTMGSVSQRVVGGSQAPVLVVRTQESETANPS